jgi:hypothetical protein
VIDEKTNDFPSYEELCTWFTEHSTSILVSPEVKERIAYKEAKALSNLTSPVRERFLHWWKTGELIDDLEAFGFSVVFLVKKGDPVQEAFIAFSGLYEKPNYFSLRYLYQRR